MKTKLFVAVLMLFSILSVACNNDEDTSNYESGTMNEDFQGEVDQVLDVEYKLTEEELENGVQPMELDDLTDEDIEEMLEEMEEEDDEEEDEDEGSPGPNI